MTSARRAALAFVMCVTSVPLGGCGACEPDKTPPAQGVPTSSASAAASVTPPPPLGTSPHPVALPCRAIAIDGDVRADADAGAALALRAEIPQEVWLSLAPNARLVAKDPRTTRETTFRGPGRVRACVDSLEESWIASGTFESANGAGESPGAEEWVVTPLGVVRFGAAQISVEVSGKRVRVGVGGGAAFLWIASDASARGVEGGVAPSPIDEALEKGWVRIPEGSATLAPTGSPSPLEAARSAVDVCASLGKSAHALASALLGSDAGPATAAQQVTTRRLARAACAVAALRLDLLPASDAKESVSTSLKAASPDWRTLPLVHR